jgi:uncharacterized protein YoxC
VQTVALNPVASAFLVAGYLVTSLLMAGAFLVIALGLGRLNAKLDDLIAKLDPVLSKTDQILSTTNDKLASIGDKAEEILVQGEGVAETVHSKVDKTATAVQRTIHAPIIGLNSFAAGVSRGVETFGRLQKEGGAPAGGATTADADSGDPGKERLNGRH